MRFDEHSKGGRCHGTLHRSCSASSPVLLSGIWSGYMQTQYVWHAVSQLMSDDIRFAPQFSCGMARAMARNQ